jgi:hypothetical protein
MNIKYPRNSLLKFITGLILTVPLILLPITAHAGIEESAKDEAGKAGQAYINSASKTSSGKKNSDIPNGLGATRTGYLCYLVNKDGSNYSDSKVITLYSPGCSLYPGTNNIAVTRTGLSAPSSWTDEADWDCTPFNIVSDSNSTTVTSNEDKIKQWFKEKNANGVANSQFFVSKYFGDGTSSCKAVQDFESGNCLIVIEAMLNFQYNNEETKIDYTAIPQDLKDTVYDAAYTSVSKDVDDAYKYWSYDNLISIAKDLDVKTDGKDNKRILSDIKTAYAKKAYNAAIESLDLSSIGATKRTYTTVDSPILGTIVNLIEYKGKIGSKCYCYDNYLYNYVPAALHIAEPQAGFKFIETGSKLSDDQVKGMNGVGMMIVSTEDKSQTTCDEDIAPKTPVHPAPIESTGTMTIVKNYRSLQADGTYKEDGCKITAKVSGKITIEDESKYGYTVKKWAITSDPSPAADIDSTKWESEMTNTSKVGAIQETNTKVGKVSLATPSTTLYILLEKASDIQTTYDESQGDTPAPPAKESEGTMQIVKSYRINKGGSYTDQGNHSITNISENILIEDYIYISNLTIYDLG